MLEAKVLKTLGSGLAYHIRPERVDQVCWDCFKGGNRHDGTKDGLGVLGDDNFLVKERQEDDELLRVDHVPHLLKRGSLQELQN